ncbi:MAG TPA: DNRLRE domain-containing protein, partial [Sorangium sp.]|nr:DNRLRE domain-containing protein [Sorangium sp.]
MKQIAIASSAALATLFIAATSFANTTAPSPTCTVIKRGTLGNIYNAEIWSLAPSYHVPTPHEVNTGYSSTVGEKRALFRFDLSPIPAGSLVTSAKFYALTYTSTAKTVYVHQVLAPWSEDLVTWNNLGAIDPTSFTSFVPNVTGWSTVDLTGLVRDWVSGVSPSYGATLQTRQIKKHLGTPHFHCSHLVFYPTKRRYRPSSVVPGVPDWLDDVVARATAPAPEDRFPSAAALEEALAGQGAEAAEPATRCALCGGPDPFGAGLCPGCGGGSDGAGEMLVVLQRPVGAPAVAVARSRLAAILPATGQDAEAAALGERPLFRTSSDAARRIVEQLGSHQLAARAVPTSRVLELLPASFHLMLVAVVIAGAAAGMSA